MTSPFIPLTVEEIRAGATVQNGHVDIDDPEIAELLNDFKTNDTLVCGSTRSFADLRKSLDEKAQALPKSFLYDCIARNELGCAELLYRVAKGDIVYDRASEAWYWWNNLHWPEDRGGNIYGLVGDVLSAVYRQTAAEKYQELLDFQATIGSRTILTDDEKEKIADLKEDMKSAEDQAKTLYKLFYIRNVLVFAGATELLGVVGEEWDAQTHLLGVQNAVLDLTTGKPVAPKPSQYIRTIAPAAYDPQAQCPVWLKTIAEIFAHNTEIIAYIQRFLGYAMSGTCHESDFHCWHGKDGRNGKEFVLERIRSVLGGKLAGTVEAELLLRSKSDKAKNGATPALMALQGRRLAWASEINEGRTLDNAAMKDLSGGHILTGRHLHQGQVEWKRTHTLILLTNHRPHVGGGGGGAEWERIKLVPFTESFVNEPDPNDPHQHLKDPTLGEKIDANELSGVLNWLLAGCLDWRKNGLQPPDIIKAATAQYKSDEDTLGRFIDECCVVFVNAKAESGELFKTYQQWCIGNGDSPMGSKTFSGKIEDRGFRRYKSGSVRGFTGIGLVTNRVVLP
jgi:putative DNA primase/helicase